jgi:hypothetical protein
MFPITSRFMLWGHSIMKAHPNHGQGARYQDVHDEEFVKRANIFATRFANRMIFSNTAHHEALVQRYGGRSPVLSVKHLKTRTGRSIVTQNVFGTRKSKPKWKA